MVRGTAGLEDVEPLKPITVDDGRLFPTSFTDRWWKRLIIAALSPIWVTLFAAFMLLVLVAYLLWFGAIGQPIAYICTGRFFDADLEKGWWPKKENKS